MAKKGIIVQPGDPDWDDPSYKEGWGDALPPKEARQKKLQEWGDTGHSYGMSDLAHTPFSKTAQATGVNTIYTNPMWFSPLHTPQSWQVASRRREIYQWSYITSKNDDFPCFLTKYDDFSLEKIEDVYTLMNSKVVDDKDLYIQNAQSKPAKIDKATKRHVKKKANRIKVMGVPLALTVTYDHDCVVIKKRDIKCGKNLSKSKNCINGKNAPTCQRINCQIYKTIDYPISKIKAEKVEKGDYFLVPFSKEVRESVIKNADQAKFAGHLASDGTVSEKHVGTRIFMHSDEVEYVLPPVEKTFNGFGFSAGVKTAKHSEKLVTARTGSKAVWQFATKLVKGKHENKHFTDQVMFLDPELQRHVLGAYIQSDGWSAGGDTATIMTVSPHLANQLLVICYRCGILAFANRFERNDSGRFKTKNKYYYYVSIPASDVYTLAPYCLGKLGHHIRDEDDENEEFVYTYNYFNGNMEAVNSCIHPKKRRTHNKRFFWKNYVVSPVTSNTCFDYEGDVYDVRAPDDFTVTANGVAVHQCRFFYECILPETPVLMADGTEKPIARVQIGDEVITETGDVRKVKNIFKRYTKENILEIRVAGSNRYIRCTKNHEIPRISKKDWYASHLTTPSLRRKRERQQQFGEVEFNEIWDDADTLSTSDYLFTPSTPVGPGLGWSSEKCYALGAFVAEGCYYWYTYKNQHRPKGIRYTISSTEMASFGNAVATYLKKTQDNKVTVKEYDDRNATDIRVANVKLAQEFHQFCGSGAKSKVLSSEFMEKANKEELLNFLGGYIDGDGCYNVTNGCQIVTHSDDLASQISFICEKLGLTFSFRDTLEEREDKVFKGHNIRISRHSCDMLRPYSRKITDINSHHTKYREYLHLGNRHYRKINKIKEERYEGWVYDLEIDGIHSYCVNRCVVHNSEPKVAAGIDFYCFEPSMQVLMADGTQKAISSVVPGELVRSHDGSVNEVDKKFVRQAKEQMLKITFSGVTTGPMRVTKDHELFTEIDGEIKKVRAKELKVGDVLLSPSKKSQKKEKLYIHRKILKITEYEYEGNLYDLEVKNKHSYVVNRVACSNSQFPINGFKLTWPHGRGEKKLLPFFERETKRLDLVNLLRQISSEYFMLGDVFAHTDIHCTKCHGEPTNPVTGQLCDHAGGNISRVKILNPDWIEVTDTIFADEPQIILIPDEQIVRIVSTRQPRQIYDRLPERVRRLVLAKKPIPLSNRVVSHLKHMAVPYGIYGTSLIRRLFTTLAYKTKIMTANWIVAERLIIPIRVVKIGSDNRPATSADIAEVNQQLAVAANDPNMTLVTHHNFEYDWYGACHDEETEVLTRTGFKKYGFFDPDEEILTYNVYTKTLEYQKPQAFHEYDYDGEMVHFLARNFDINVTPNHRMLIQKHSSNKLESIQASEISRQLRFVGASKIGLNACSFNKMYIHQRAIVGHDLSSNDEEMPIIIIGDQAIDLDVFLKFAGYYLSDGSLQAKKSNYHISISQELKKKTSYKKENVLENIEKTLSKLPWHVGKYSYRPNELNLVISNKKLVVFMLEQFGHGAANKSIPTWIKNLPPSYLEILIDAMVEGDGHNRKTQNAESFSYKSSSEQLIDDFQEITFKCGFATKKRKCKTSRCSFGKKPIWDISASRGFLSHGSRPCVRKHHISRVPYKGKVWCFTVPNGFFVTRRNGKITIQGNSGKILQLGQEMEHIDKEMLDGLMLNQALLNGEMCLTSCHKVLTTDGWKWIHEITTEDSVCVWDSETTAFHYEKPEKIFKYDNVETIYEIRSGDKVLFECTGKHNIVIKSVFGFDRKVPAEELRENLDSVYTLMRDGSYYKITEIRPKSYGNAVYCLGTSTGFFVAKYQDVEFISSNSGYQSAQVGVEVLIRRIEAWRTTLAEWVEEKIFRPIAQMKGLIDKEASDKLGERVWLYPSLKWNDLNLKDKTQWYQLLMQLHDKQVISTQTLCEELDLEYDREIERLRYEMATAGPMGAQLGGPPGMGGMLGGGAGGLGAPGGGAAAPPSPFGAGPEGGMPGVPGGEMGGGVPGGGGMPGAAGVQPMQIVKRSKAKALEKQEEPMQYGQVKFTQIEQEFRKMLDNIVGTLKITMPYFFQFKVEKTAGGHPYVIDFAFPQLKLGFENDGQIFHSNPTQLQHDQQRDYELAMKGWTVVRFDDKTIEEQPQAVQNTTVSYLKKAMQAKTMKKGSTEGESHYHSVYADKLFDIYQDDLPNGLADLISGEE